MTTSATSNKIVKVNDSDSDMIQAIGTHDGTFHADDVMACYMLRNHIDQYRDYPIVRSRDPAVHNKLPVLVDVGGVYNADTQRFDHHQREFHDTFDDGHHVRLSSAGLIYKHYGHQIIRSILQQYGSSRDHNKNTTSPAASTSTYSYTDTDIELIYQQVYNNLIQSLDGIDNGVLQYTVDESITPNYTISTDLSSRIGHLNPAWNEESNPDILLKQFYKAMTVAGDALIDAIVYVAKAWLPARHVVEQAFHKRFDIDSSGHILLLPHHTVWKAHVIDLEHETNTPTDQQILYVLYPDDKHMWRVQAMPSDRNTAFSNRLQLPDAWRGRRDKQLVDICGIDGATFVHATGFIGGNETQQGAIRMAQKAIELGRNNNADISTMKGKT